ncbi:MAG: hypothetical protein QXR84_02085 [Candidatus Bathyarchaeia archaeon]|nr:hypothetical protein [Candidatus Bathyarchaeota archaeon]
MPSFLILKHRELKVLRGLEDDSVVFIDYYCEKRYKYEDSNKLLGTTNNIE